MTDNRNIGIRIISGAEYQDVTDINNNIPQIVNACLEINVAFGTIFRLM